MTEAQYTAKLRGVLNSLPRSDFDKIHGGLYQASGISDLVGCVDGIYVAIEVKKPGNTETALQYKFQKTKERAGGVVLTVYTSEHPASVVERVQLAVHRRLGAIT